MFKSLLAYFGLESEAPENEKGIVGQNAFDNISFAHESNRTTN